MWQDAGGAPGTEWMDARQLAELVTRDSMIGVARALPPKVVDDG